MANRNRKALRAFPSDQVMFAYYNLGRLIGIRRCKKDAKLAAEEFVGNPWDEIKNHIEIHKVIVKKV